MRAIESARAFGGAVMIYLVMAACGGSDSIVSAMRDGGTVGDADLGAVAVADAVSDSIVSPEHDALAGPLTPEEVTEPCDKVLQYGPNTYRYAEHAYPGVSATTLGLSVMTLRHLAPGAGAAPPGYLRQQYVAAYVKEGFAAVACGGDTEITFIRRLD